MKFKLVVAVILILAVICALAACSTAEENTGGDLKSRDQVASDSIDGDFYEGMVSEGRLYFHVSKTEALLVDSAGSLLWLYSSDKSIFEGFDSGDYVKVRHGAVMESYPGQTYISRIDLVEDGDISSFSDEEWERLSWVFADGLEIER